MNNHGFELVQTRPVPALNLTVEEYVHSSGAKHYHLANEYAENVFMLALRTVPEDSTGVAHILEHTALCGSERFPVRDPFFLMIRRSLNTFMNAFTTSDYTAYPFASQNRKDYFNLLAVYLDAVFFSRLDKRDFAQEGHRVEFEIPNDPTTPLVYKGVVYNEMKGDTSSPLSMLYHAIQEVLYPSSTYHYNSGGDPKVIPELSYEGLQKFYRSHYHPANAIFMTFGDISAAEQQQQIAELALDRLPAREIAEIRVKPEVRYTEPVAHEISYPVDDDELTGKTHVVLAWLLGRNTDLDMLLKGHLLSDVLLDTSASPLRQALEESDLASGVSPMCGFEEDHMEMNFMCGVEGSDEEHADAIEALILSTLQRVAEDGVEQDRLEAVLHQLELSQREIGGDGMPYGLQLIFSCMSAAVHRGDPIGLLDLDEALESLRRQIEDPHFIGDLIRELLLDNTHRVRVVMKPDRQLGATLIREEEEKLASLKDSLSPEACQSIVAQAQELTERQAREENLDLLPKVTVADVPPTRHYPELESGLAEGRPISFNTAGTNGIVYHQIIRPVPALSSSLLGLLPVYNQIITEVGSAGRDYLETQHLQHGVSGGISAFSSIRTDAHDTDTFRSYSTLSSRTLSRKGPEMASLLKETSLEPRFDELQRINDVIQQVRTRRLHSVASGGHQYAMSAAAARFRPVAAINDYLSGIPGIMRLNTLAKYLVEPEAQRSLGERLATLHDSLRQSPETLLSITDSEHLEDFARTLLTLWQDEPNLVATSSLGSMATSGDSDDMAFVVTSQVNYCAAAFPTVPEAHEDSSALSILGGVLRNNFLHTEIREKGGAYGGGAGHDSANGIFRFYSYRDPRTMETFDTFERAVEWSLASEMTDGMLEEAVLGVMGSLDSPGSPAGEIRQAFHHDLFGRTSVHRQESRRRYLDVRQDDLKRVAATYLSGSGARAIVTSENRLSEIDNRFDTVRVNEEEVEYG